MTTDELPRPAWEHYLEARRVESWACPEDGCTAVNQSAGLLGDHLVAFHNWTETELRLWWSGE